MRDDKYRAERIERLFYELRRELEIGCMEGDISETIGFEFVIPVSKEIPGGVVSASFRMRPIHRDSMCGRDLRCEPRIKLVKDKTR